MNANLAKIELVDAGAISQAAEILRTGGLVAFPTETVYGLGGDATSSEAVARIFEAKGRPSFNPLICHVADLEAAREIAEFPGPAETLAEAFWPGPLTMVLPRARSCPVSPLASAGLETIAVRIPAQKIAQKLLRALRRPVAAPSANAAGKISPTRAAHVAASLGDKVDLIMDGGPCEIGIESTILHCAGDQVSLLRAGALGLEEIAGVLGADTIIVNPKEIAPNSPMAPGQLPTHYAPDASLRINITRIEPGEALLAFGPDLPRGHGQAEKILNLSPGGDLVEAAANLFSHLHLLDAAGATGIACMPVPEIGLGVAINDRLRRASAPRQKVEVP